MHRSLPIVLFALLSLLLLQGEAEFVGPSVGKDQKSEIAQEIRYGELLEATCESDNGQNLHWDELTQAQIYYPAARSRNTGNGVARRSLAYLRNVVIKAGDYVLDTSVTDMLRQKLIPYLTGLSEKDTHFLFLRNFRI